MNKVIMFLIPVLVGGAVVGLGLSGVVNIPGLTPKKKPTAVAKADEKPKEAPKPKSKPKEEEAMPKVVGDPTKGYETVASLWNEMSTPKLIEISAKWRDEDLGPILLRMEPDKVVQFLGQIKPDRAAKLTKVIQKLAEAS